MVGHVSATYKAGATESQVITTISFSDRLQGSISTLELPSKTDKGNNITYTVVWGPVTVSGNKLSLTGQPGRVVVKGFSPAGLKYSAAKTQFEFCVNPSKPTISITEQATQYVFTSSTISGNNWYRNNIALNVTDRSINMVSTNLFTVQVIIDGCKSAFSSAKAASKEIVLAEEPMAKAGISVYPNPILNELNMEFGNTKINLVIINDLAGKSIYVNENVKTSKLNIDLKQLPKGIYILNLQTNKGEFSKKLLKE